MACRASAGALASTWSVSTASPLRLPTLEVDVVLVSERKEVVARVSLNRLNRISLGVDKVDLDAGR